MSVINVLHAIVLGVCLAGVTPLLHAQQRPTQKGAIEVAGAASVTRLSEDDGQTVTKRTSISPRVGYFFVSGLQASLNVRYFRLSQETPSGPPFATTEWGLGPGLTYYLPVGTARVIPYVAARALLTRTSALQSSFDGPSRDVSINRATWIAAAGGLFLLNKHIGLTGEFFFSRERTTVSGDLVAPIDPRYAEQLGTQFGVAAFLF